MVECPPPGTTKVFAFQTFFSPSTPQHPSDFFFSTHPTRCSLQKMSLEEAGSDEVVSRLVRSSKEGDMRNIHAEAGRAVALGVIDRADRNGMTPLAWAVWNQHTDAAAALLQAGADPDIRDDDGQTALFIAALAGCVEGVRVLLAANASVDIADSEDETPFSAAATKGHIAVLQALSDAGADPLSLDADGLTPLLKSRRAGDVQCTTFLQQLIVRHTQASGTVITVKDGTSCRPDVTLPAEWWKASVGQVKKGIAARWGVVPEALSFGDETGRQPTQPTHDDVCGSLGVAGGMVVHMWPSHLVANSASVPLSTKSAVTACMTGVCEETAISSASSSSSSSKGKKRVTVSTVVTKHSASVVSSRRGSLTASDGSISEAEQNGEEAYPEGVSAFMSLVSNRKATSLALLREVQDALVREGEEEEDCSVDRPVDSVSEIPAVPAEPAETSEPTEESKEIPDEEETPIIHNFTSNMALLLMNHEDVMTQSETEIDSRSATVEDPQCDAISEQAVSVDSSSMHIAATTTTTTTTTTATTLSIDPTSTSTSESSLETPNGPTFCHIVTQATPRAAHKANILDVIERDEDPAEKQTEALFLSLPPPNVEARSDSISLPPSECGVAAAPNGIQGEATPLHRAAVTGEALVAEYIISAGACVDAPDPKGRTPLMWAAIGGQLRIVRLLLQQGANHQIRDADGCTALFHAAVNGKNDILQFFHSSVKNCPFDGLDSEGHGMVQWAAYNGYLSTLRFLVEVKNLRVDIPDFKDKLAVHWAARQGKCDCLRYLVSKGTPVSLKDCDGKTPEDHALETKQWGAVSVLRESRIRLEGGGVSVQWQNCASKAMSACEGIVLAATSPSLVRRESTTMLRKGGAVGINTTRPKEPREATRRQLKFPNDLLASLRRV